MSTVIDVKSPRVSIEYCTKCRWMLRAAWLGQELLTTFDTMIGELAIIPGSAAVFQIKVDDVIIWDRKEKGRFPEVKEVKQLLRDIIAPEMSLGHSDRKKPVEQQQQEPKSEEECKTCKPTTTATTTEQPTVEATSAVSKPVPPLPENSGEEAPSPLSSKSNNTPGRRLSVLIGKAKKSITTATEKLPTPDTIHSPTKGSNNAK